MFDNIKYKLQEIWFTFLNNPNVERVQAWYQTLSSRDRRMLKVGFAFLVSLLSLYVISSFLTGISTKQENIQEMITVTQKLDDLNDFMQANSMELQKKKTDTLDSKYVSLIDLVEKQQAAALIKPESRLDIKETPKKEVDKGKFYENSAEVKYEKISIRQLAKLLAGIEKNENFARIDFLKIARRTDDIRYIDVSFDVVARTPK
ncbi:MAG: hypothetical protein WCJ57_04720 [Candidatus Falkowbacteria bacterium]